MKTLTIFYVVFLWCCLLAAEPSFISVKNEDWREHTKATIESLEATIANFLASSDGYQIAYHENSYTAYYSVFRYPGGEPGEIKKVPQLLVVTRATDVKFIHEFAHLIMDNYMRIHSLGWQYYLGYSDLEFPTLENYVESLEAMNQSLLKQHDHNHKAIEKFKREGKKHDLYLSSQIHLKQTIQSNLEKIDKYLKLARLQSQANYSLANLKTFSFLESYSEVFADLVTVLYLKDWEALRKDIAADLERSHLGESVPLSLPPLATPELSEKALLDHRDFLIGVSMENYEYAQWEEKDVYSHFLPLRSFLREWVQDHPEVAPATIVQAFLDAIVNTLEENFLQNGDTFRGRLKDKNINLRNQFLKAVDSLLD